MRYGFVKKMVTPLLVIVIGLGMAQAKAHADPYAKFAGTTLVVNFPAHAQYDAAAKIIPEFTKATGIKVEIDKVEYMRMRDKQLLELSKPKGDYDVISYVCMWKTEYVSKGLLTALAPFFTNPGLADPTYDPRDFVPAYLATTGLVGGKKGYLPGPSAALYGVPFGSETSIFAYRKDIFDKHGLKPPKTYDEMLKIARIIREKEPKMYGLTSRGEAGHQVAAAWLFHLTPFGGEVFDDNWEPAFHKESSLKAIYALQEIVKTGPPGITTFAFGSMADAFLLGHAVMYLDATVISGMVRNPAISKIDGKVAYAVHPKAKVISGETGGFGMAIPQNSTKKEAAFLLIQWLTSKDSDKKLIKLGGMPNRLSTLQDPALQKEYPEFKVILEGLKYANPDWRPIIPEWPEISMQYLGYALHEVITGKKTPEKAMNDIREPVRKIMEKAGYYSWKK